MVVDVSHRQDQLSGSQPETMVSPVRDLNAAYGNDPL